MAEIKKLPLTRIKHHLIRAREGVKEKLLEGKPSQMIRTHKEFEQFKTALIDNL